MVYPRCNCPRPCLGLMPPGGMAGLPQAPPTVLGTQLVPLQLHPGLTLPRQSAVSPATDPQRKARRARVTQAVLFPLQEPPPRPPGDPQPGAGRTAALHCGRLSSSSSPPSTACRRPVPLRYRGTAAWSGHLPDGATVPRRPRQVLEQSPAPGAALAASWQLPCCVGPSYGAGSALPSRAASSPPRVLCV